MQLVLVIIIIALAVLYAVSMFRRVRRGGSCNCGCCDQYMNCNPSQSCDCCPMKQKVDVNECPKQKETKKHQPKSH